MMPEPPPRPDLRADGLPLGGRGRPGPAPATAPRRTPVVTWRFLPAIGVALLGFLLGSLAAAPIFALFGDTTEGGASGISELAQGLVVDLVLVGVLVALAATRGTADVARGAPLVPRVDVAREVAIGAGLGVAVRIVAGIAVAIIVAVLVGGDRRRGVGARAGDREPPRVPAGRLRAVRRHRRSRDRGVPLPRAALPVDPRPLRGRRSGRPSRRCCSGRSTSCRRAVAATRVALQVDDGRHRSRPGAGSTNGGKTLLAPIAGHAAFNLIAVVVVVFDALR